MKEIRSTCKHCLNSCINCARDIEVYVCDKCDNDIAKNVDIYTFDDNHYCEECAKEKALEIYLKDFTQDQILGFTDEPMKLFENEIYDMISYWLIEKEDYGYDNNTDDDYYGDDEEDYYG